MTTQPPDSTTPSEADLPRFKSPKAMPSHDTLDPAATSTRDLGPEPVKLAYEELVEGPGGSDGPNAGTGSWRSTTPSRVFTEQAAFYEQVLGTGLGVATMVAHSRLSPDEDAPLWLASDEEIAAVAQPLSRILARHTPAPGGAKASDIADGIEAGVAVAGYVVANLRAQAEYAATEAPADFPPGDE